MFLYIWESGFDHYNKIKSMKIIRKLLDQEPTSALYDLIENYYPDYADDNFRLFDSEMQTFILIANVDGEINNGGVIQFIDNGSGDFFHETIDAAKRIHAEGLAAILTKAATQFPNGQIPKDWDERRNLWDQVSDAHEDDDTWTEFWEELDDWYYSNSATVHQNLIDYLRSHAVLED